MNDILNHYLQKQQPGVWRAFDRLSDAHKEAVQTAFMTHVRACVKSRVPVDPHFLPEIIGDVRSGIYFKEEAMAARV